MKFSSNTWIAIAIIGATAAIFAFALFGRGAETTSAAPLPPITAADHVKGATTTPAVTVVEYMDLECSVCASYFPVMTDLEKEYGDRVQFVVRYFPLPMHINSLQAAYAAEAAGQQGKFWDMHDLLFTTQSTWGGKASETPEAFEVYAQQLGLNMDQFRTDVKSDAVQDRVAKDLQEGREMGINATPTFFINGQKIQNPGSLEAFKTLIDAQL